MHRKLGSEACKVAHERTNGSRRKSNQCGPEAGHICEVERWEKAGER
jgi:hypothetical protein